MKPRTKPRTALAKELCHIRIDLDVSSEREMTRRLGWTKGRMQTLLRSETASLTAKELAHIVATFNLSSERAERLRSCTPGKPVRMTFKNPTAHGARLLDALAPALPLLSETDVNMMLSIIEQAVGAPFTPCPDIDITELEAASY